uniref:Telomeric single stranded DNA binding POT1/Cdc13 domain-containing protein n=1 Tax=Timema shepardi TaxID=629360 RepID=A0A7R9FVJ4_TIMSH|nr:unnamed protein product [Timema shepardi]
MAVGSNALITCWTRLPKIGRSGVDPGQEPEEKSVAKPLQKMSYQYTTISNIIEPIKEVHVYGVIKTIEKAPTATKNLKMMSRVILVDDSIDATKMFFRLHIFYNRHDEQPKIELNHILRVHRMQVEKFNNGVDGRVFRTTDLLTFSPNPDDHDNFFSTANTFELTDRDLVRVQELRTWLKSQEWFTGQTNAEILPLQTELRHISAPIKFNLICKIVNVSLSKKSECIVLTVADGTACPSKLIKVDSAQNLMLHDILNSSNFQENLIEVDVIVLNPTEEFKLLKEGQFVQLQNMKSKEVPNKFSSDEVLMILVLDTNGGSFLNYQPHHSKAKEINRKLDDISKNMEDSVDERLTRLAKGKHVYSFDNSYSFISNEEEELNEQLMSPKKAKHINPMLKTNEQLSHELSPHTSKSNDSFIHSSPQTSKSNALVIHSSPRASKSWGSPSTSISSTSKLEGINTTAKQTCQHSPISNSKIISPLSKKVDIQIDKSSPLCPTKSINLLGNSNHENIGSPPSPSVATLEPIDKRAFKKRLNMDLDLPGNMPIYAKQDAIISSPQSKSTAANKRSTVSQIDNTNDRGILLKISLTGLNSKNVIEKAEPIKSIKNVDQNPFEIEEEQDNLNKDVDLVMDTDEENKLTKNNVWGGNLLKKPLKSIHNDTLLASALTTSLSKRKRDRTRYKVTESGKKDFSSEGEEVEASKRASLDLQLCSDINLQGSSQGMKDSFISTSCVAYNKELNAVSVSYLHSSKSPLTTSSNTQSHSPHNERLEDVIISDQQMINSEMSFTSNVHSHLSHNEKLEVGPTIVQLAKSSSVTTFTNAQPHSLHNERLENVSTSSQKVTGLSATVSSNAHSHLIDNKSLENDPIFVQQTMGSPRTTSSNTQPHSPNNNILENLPASAQQGRSSLVVGSSNAHLLLPHHERPVDSPICDSENLEEILLCDKQMTELPATTSNVLCVAHDKENEIISLSDRQESPIPLFNSVESEQNIGLRGEPYGKTSGDHSREQTHPVTGLLKYIVAISSEQSHACTHMHWPF